MSQFQALTEKLSEISDIHAAMSLMMWDMEVMMPPGGAAMRGRQLATMHGIYHKKFVKEAGPLMEELEISVAGLDDFQKLNMKQLLREHYKRIRLPQEHVVEGSRLTSEAFHAWEKARKANDFAAFQPYLEKVVALKLREADYLGYDDNPYDALIDQFEQGMKAAEVTPIFEPFKSELSGLLKEISDRPQVPEALLLQQVDEDKQLALGLKIVTALGYDMNCGRQDKSTHPFSISFHPNDARITTRINTTDIREMLYSSIHEAGHSMYEQGLSTEHYGLPAAEYCSLSIHESQSRLWENNVGRSLAFCEYFFDDVAAVFPDKLKGKTPEDLFRAVNRVQPGLIRISADELTYHFHVIMRFELENDLINQRLKVKDLPEAWNAKVKSYLGLDVPDAANGVLQDIHWSHGSIGYFPTYSLGSFYAAQLMHATEAAHPDLQAGFRKGDFAPVKDWMGQHIHSKGKLYSAEQLCEMATGEPLNVKYFIDYARQKFGQVYGINTQA